MRHGFAREVCLCSRVLLKIIRTVHCSGKQGRAVKKKRESVKGKKQWTKTRKRGRPVQSKSRKTKPKAKHDAKKDGEVTTVRAPVKRGRTEDEENVTSQRQRGVAASRAKIAKVEKKSPLVTMTKKERKDARRKGKGNYDMIKNALKMWENLRRYLMNG